MQFDESFLKKLEYLYVVSRKVFAGRMRAERRTRKIGSGVEFADHRDYTAGDDLRYLDWSAYGRLDKLLLRLFEEEEDLHIYLLVDASASMRANGKLDYALTVTAALAYVGLAKLDRVSIVPFGGPVRDRLPPARGKGQIFKIFSFLSELSPEGRTDLNGACESFVHQSKRRGIAVVISDFFDPQGYEAGLNLLRYHRFEPTVVQIWDEREAHPGLRGDVELVDAETGELKQVTITERALRDYEAAHAAWCDGLASYCASRSVPYYRADTQVPFDDLVLRIFRAGGFLA
jgi:uncharacterized protein (DUF58 family)